MEIKVHFPQLEPVFKSSGEPAPNILHILHLTNVCLWSSIWHIKSFGHIVFKCLQMNSKDVNQEPEQGHHVMFLRKTPFFSCLHLPPPKKKNCTGWSYWLIDKFNISPVCPNQVPGVNTGNPVMFWQNHPSQYCDQESLHQHSLPIHKAVSEKEQCQPWTYDRCNN